MDRPISSNSQKKRQWLKASKAVSIGFVVIVCLYFIYWLLTPSMNRNNISIAKVELGELVGSFNASGVVLPLFEETISSQINSRVLKVLVKAGEYVEKGQLLLKLDTQQLQLQLDSIAENIALKDSQIETAFLKSQRALNDIKSRKQLLEVDLESRQTRVNRLSQLSQIGASSKQDLTEAQLNVKRTRIELSQLAQSISDIKKTAKSEQASLKLEKSILQKELKEQQRLLDLAHVVATRSGLVSWLKEEEGSSVTQGDALVKIADSEQYRIEATLSDFYAQQLQPDMAAIIHIKDARLKGKLDKLAPRFENGVMKISVNLEKASSHLLRNNMRVEVELVTHVVANTLRIAKGQFVNGSGLQDVFVVKNGTAHKQQVSIGLSSKDFYQIEKGLQVDDQVIISNVSEMMHLNQFTIN